MGLGWHAIVNGRQPRADSTAGTPRRRPALPVVRTRHTERDGLLYGVRPLDRLEAMSPATRAREDARLSVEEAAQLARISPAYLKRKEREGGFSVAVASRLERICHAPITVFLARNVSHREETNGRKKANKRTTTQGRRSVAFPAASAVDSGRGERA